MNPIDEAIINEEEALRFIKEFPNKISIYAINVLICILLFVIGTFLINLVRKAIKHGLKKKGSDENTQKFVDNFIHYTLLAALVGSLSIKLGVETAAIATLLASVGVAIGLAIQGSLGNFAGGVLIIILKPFKVGDYIIEGVKGREGKVLEISLIYTKILNYQNEIIILPNGTLANSDTVNLTANPYRRVDHKFAVSYDTDIAKAKEVLYSVIAERENILKEPKPNIVLAKLDDSSVVIKLMFYVANENYWPEYFAVLEEGKLALDKAGITIPFNQLDVHVKS